MESDEGQEVGNQDSDADFQTEDERLWRVGGIPFTPKQLKSSSSTFVVAEII